MAAVVGPLADEQVAEFERDGCTTVETGLTEEQLDYFEAMHDADTLGAPHPAYFEFIAHPEFEAIAQQILRSDNVRILESGPNRRPPEEPGTPEPTWGEKHGTVGSQWAHGMHSDGQVSLSDFNATPRREHLALWVWLKPVVPERAALRVLKGSHIKLQEHWEKMLSMSPDRLPIEHGPRWEDPGEPDAKPFAAMEPTPMVARRGQATAWTQAALHSLWFNSDSEPRSGFAISWTALESSVGGMAFRWHDQEEMSADRIEGIRQRSIELRSLLPADRRHIMFTLAELDRSVAQWDEKWPGSLRQRFRL
jgi:ectoine hydroxylase-related dioxygenase (phytanoyl-CoA dioxygenase family)